MADTETKTIPLIAGLVILLALVGTTYYITNLDQTYYCENKNVVTMCFKLSNPTNGLSSRCYYNETTPTKYLTCTSGWKPIKDFPDIMNNLTITGTPISVKSYDDNLKEITIFNSIGGVVTNEIAKATLDTPQINYVMPGKDRRVAEITIDSYTDYTDFIKGMSLIDNNNGKPIDREINYKYKEVTYKDVPILKETCFETGFKDANGTNLISCTTKEDGTRKQEIVNWIPLEKLDIKAEKITIGIYTDVLKGDNVEWVIKMFGLDLTEWATWTDGLSVGLELYHDCNSSKEVLRGNNNLTAHTGSAIYNGSNCLIGNCAQFGYKQNGFMIQTGTINTNFTQPLTLNFWVRPTESASTPYAFIRCTDATCTGNSGITEISNSPAGAWDLGTTNWIGGTYYNMVSSGLNAWTMITYTRYQNGTATFYINGTPIYTGASNWDAASGSTGLLFGGTAAGAAMASGTLDEILFWNRSLSPSEVSDLYNNGAGIAPKPIGTINIIGCVRDTSNNVVAGATVLLLNSSGGLVNSITTNSSGDWIYDFLDGTLVNYTIVAYNKNNLSQGGNAYPFFNA